MHLHTFFHAPELRLLLRLHMLPLMKTLPKLPSQAHKNQSCPWPPASSDEITLLALPCPIPEHLPFPLTYPRTDQPCTWQKELPLTGIDTSSVLERKWTLQWEEPDFGSLADPGSTPFSPSLGFIFFPQLMA